MLFETIFQENFIQRSTDIYKYLCIFQINSWKKSTKHLSDSLGMFCVLMIIIQTLVVQFGQHWFFSTNSSQGVEPVQYGRKEQA